MPTTIDDKIITDSLYLNRFDAGQRKEIEKLFQKMRKELLDKLDSGYGSELSRKRMTTLITEIDLVIDDYYYQMSDNLDVEALAQHVTEVTQAAVQSAIPISIAASLPTATHMKSIISNVMFDGSPIPAWWDKQSADVKFKFGGIVRQGIAQAQPYYQLVNPVTELLDVSKRNAFGLVNTAIQTVANDARMATFEANADVIKYLVWKSTLDSHTCIKCVGRSGKKWKVDKTPIDHSIPFQLPPIHFKDRCVMSAQSIYAPEESHKDFTRASSIGQVDAKTTFDQYLKRVPDSQVDEMLGKGRAQMWRDGKITTSQLLDQSGRELTLEQLKAKYL